MAATTKNLLRDEMSHSLKLSEAEGLWLSGI